MKRIFSEKNNELYGSTKLSLYLLFIMLILGNVSHAQVWDMQLDRLPYLSPNVSAGLQSSHDRTGGNYDFINYLYTDPNSENVMLDLKGSGTVNRIWITAINQNDTSGIFKVYIDGETTPRVNYTIKEFYSGKNAPFLSPVCRGWSTGGRVSYVPISFKKSIKITYKGNVYLQYYNIGYEMYTPDAPITPWTSALDVSATCAIWNNPSKDPKPAVTTTTVSNTVNIAKNQTQTLLDINGARSIASIRIHIPVVNPLSLSDNGRWHKGYSQFRVAVNQSNNGVRLQRRLDYFMGDQTADVSVDGVLAGRWTTPGSNGVYRWKNSDFDIPSTYTAGKDSVTIRVTFVSSTNEWTEYMYWVYSKSNTGIETQTDSLNVSNAASELKHSYIVNTGHWSGNSTFQYPPSSNSSEILKNTFLKIFWDNESVPGVDAPLESFFAIGRFGYGKDPDRSRMIGRSLMIGLDTAYYFYCYFPMPFEKHCKISIVNEYSENLSGVKYEIKHSAFNDPFDNIGYFRTKFNHAIHLTPTGTNDGSDIIYLDTVGSGKFVGIVESMHGFGGTDKNYLEGDERFYIDNNRSPALHGTGTEDFYNCGWYFVGGPANYQLWGCPSISSDANGNHCSATYRFMLSDAVPFRSRIRAGIEHGQRNNYSQEAWTLAYYYLNSKPSAVPTDSVDVGNTNSETAHAYVADSLILFGSKTNLFLGELDNISITEDGRSRKGTCSFNMSILPENNGVIIRRMFEQIDQTQQAEVFINDSLVGTWYHSGINTSRKWKEDEFMVPASFTKNKSSIKVSLKHTGGTPDWNEYKYWVYSMTNKVTSDTLSPTVPTALNSSNITPSGFTLSWTASTDNKGVTGYEVFKDGVSVGTTATTSINVTGLTCNTSYSMKVRARDAFSNWSAQSAALNVTTSICDIAAPSIPTGLAASAITHSSFTLSWTPSTDNVGVVSYEVFKDGVSIGSTTTNSINVTGLTSVTTYRMTVKAKDAAGNASAASAGLNVSTVVAPLTSTLTTVADAFIRGGAYVDNNYGTDTVLIEKTSSVSADYTRVSYLKFDISGLTGTVNSAVLQLYVRAIETPGVLAQTLRLVNDDSWGETTITYNNQPTNLGAVISNYNVSTLGLVTIDITAALLAETDGTLSLKIETTLNNAVTYRSKEASQTQPTIVITYNSTPTQNSINNSDENNISVTPNPVTNSNQLTVKASTGNTISIYNSLGVVVFSDVMNADEIKIRTEKFPSGIYFVQIKSANKIFVIKCLVI